jgi:hypothetical protein
MGFWNLQFICNFIFVTSIFALLAYLAYNSYVNSNTEIPGIAKS